MKAWTDYPFENFGDVDGKQAPIREITVLSYDQDKYCRILVGNSEEEIKAGYICTAKGRYGEVPSMSAAQLKLLPPTD